MVKDKKRTDTFKALGAQERTLDNPAKNMLKQKSLSAAVLKHAFPDVFQDMTIVEIMEGIDDVQLYSTVDDLPPVSGNEKTRMRNTVNTESSGEILFDSLFDACFPDPENTKGNMQTAFIAIVDIEIQNASYQRQRLVYRIVYYASRMISMQKNAEFQGQQYENLKPVRLIWIMPHASEEHRGTLKLAYSSPYPESQIAKDIEKAALRLFETSVFFFNKKSLESQDPQIRFMANLFYQNDRRKIEEFLQKEGIPVLEETVDAISLFGDQLCTLNEEQQVEYINALKQIKELSAKNSMLSAEIEKKDQEYQLILDKRDQQVETLEEEIKLLKMQMERMQRNNH
jgi:hypothetical protein